MEKTRSRKVVCYVVRDAQVLVFTHRGVPLTETGVQVPAGTIEAGERPVDAALREAREETGLRDLRVVRELGQDRYDCTPMRPEVMERHFVELAVDGEVPDRWAAGEQDPADGGAAVEWDCWWLPLEKGHVLAAGQGAMLHALLEPPPPAREAAPDDCFALRPLRIGDAPAVLAAFRSHDDMTRQGAVTDLPNALAYVERLVGADSVRAFAIVDDGGLVGLVGVTTDAANRNGWFWYWLHAAHRGRGVASRAAATVADWALSDGGCERLELGHRVNNLASGRVAAAAGFVWEGTERDKFLIDGERIDVHAYGRLASDPWPATHRLPLAE